MNKINKLIRIAGIICCIFALMFVFSFSFFQVVQLIIGGILLSYSNLSEIELKRKKTIIIIIAIISLIFNWLVSILLFVVFDDLLDSKENVVSVNENVNSDSKRIDILLKIGVGMVLVAGILIATTSWEIIPDIIKCLGLLIIGGIFLGLSRFAEIKIKIQKTIKAYYVLGLCLCWLSFICVCVLKVFSEWFSYFGAGVNLVVCLTLLLLSGILFLISKKFNEREYKYMALFVIFSCLFFFLRFLGIGIELVGLVLTVVLLLGNMLCKNERLSVIGDVSRLSSYIYWPLLLNINGINYIVVLVLIIAIINMIYLMNGENTTNKTLSIIIAYILGIELILQIDIGDIYIFIFIAASLFYSFINRGNVRIVKNINQVVYNMIATVLIFGLLDSELKIFIISLVYGIVHFINCLVINKDDKCFDYYYQPVVLFLAIYGIFRMLDNVINIDAIYYFIVSAFGYILCERYLFKDEKIKKIYYVSLVIVTVLVFLINIIEYDICAGLLLIILVSYIFLWKNYKYTWTYIFLLLTILLFKETIYDYFSYGIFLSFLNILVFGGLTYLFKDDQVLKKINLISIVIPIYSMIGYINGMWDLKDILNNILNLYILFIVVTQFIKDNNVKDKIATIFTGVILLGILFNDSMLVGLYIGILSIVILLLTYNNKDYKSLFYLGIVVTILNIIIKLSDFWSKIPLSVYLLLAGGVLIAFVTIKELKNKDQEDNKTVIKENNCEKMVKFCSCCGTKNNNHRFCPKCGTMLIKKY